MLSFDIISAFPHIQHFFDHGVMQRAIQNRIIQIQAWDPRLASNTRYQSIDDKAFGGGPGQVVRADILESTLDNIPQRHPDRKIVFLTPDGPPLTHNKAIELGQEKQIIMICGRYEGIDQRFIQLKVDECISIGDYVLTGGELPALVLCEAVTRLLPGVVGNALSVDEDSFVDGCLDHPHYTKPLLFHGHKVPEVLRSGNHSAIRSWRRMMALGNTWMKRPDLLVGQQLSHDDVLLLSQFMTIENMRNNDDEFDRQN